MTALFVPALRPIALLAIMAAVFASAQTTPPPTNPPAQEQPLPGTAAQRESIVKGGLTLDKFNRIDILGKLLPVNLTKEQIRAILPAIQKARVIEFDTRILDATLLATLDAEVTKAIEAGTAKGDVPSVELQNKIIKTTSAIVIRRRVATFEMVDLVYKACQKALDAGQMKVMSATLKPELVAPGMKADTDELKTKIFIQYIFLDGLTYDLLLKMSRPA